MTRKHRKIAVFGIFGVQNLGNECTLQAIIHNIKEILPTANLFGVVYEPEDTWNRHQLPAVPITASYSRRTKGRQLPGVPSRLSRVLRLLFRRIPSELLGWLEACWVLRDTDLIVMTGTGMLTDYCGTAFGFPYDVFKWAVAARLAGCTVRFVAVGVGPVYERLSRFFIKAALAVADYRSYRDVSSKRRLEALGVNTRKDDVVPDLAFSLPRHIFQPRHHKGAQRLVVGVGVISHFDRRSAGEHNREAYYLEYLEKMSRFIEWLVRRNYCVHILHGDLAYDAAVRRDLRAKLEKRGVSYEAAGIVDEDVASVDDLLSQLAATDLVVAPRYHNLLLAIMLEKPVISISYDPKNDALLEMVSLEKYRQSMDTFTVETLIQQFVELEGQLEAVKPRLRQSVEKSRKLLAEHYVKVVAGL